MFDPSLLYDVYSPANALSRPTGGGSKSSAEFERAKSAPSSFSSFSSSPAPKARSAPPPSSGAGKRKEREEDGGGCGIEAGIARCFLRPPLPGPLPRTTEAVPPVVSGLPPLLPAFATREFESAFERQRGGEASAISPSPPPAEGRPTGSDSDFRAEILSALSRGRGQEQQSDEPGADREIEPDSEAAPPLERNAGLMRREVEAYGSFKNYLQETGRARGGAKNSSSPVLEQDEEGRRGEEAHPPSGSRELDVVDAGSEKDERER